jgi:uncharacterized membrane protein YhhN
MSGFGIFAGMTVLAVAGLMVAEWRGSVLGRWICKPIASLGFIASALAAGLPTNGFGWAIVVALVLSFGGDVFLIPKAKVWFVAGLASFLLGHLGFAVAFLFRGTAPLWGLLALPFVTAAALVVHRWLRPHVPDRLRIPVIAYVTVISTMVIFACGTLGHRPDAQGALLFGAAVAFFCSDLAVARNRFVDPGFVNRLWGLPLYYGAQLVFAWGLVSASL